MFAFRYLHVVIVILLSLQNLLTAFDNPPSYLCSCSYVLGENLCLSPLKTGTDLVAQQRAYRGVVLDDFIESERAHINELQQLVVNYLQPIEKSHM